MAAHAASVWGADDDGGRSEVPGAGRGRRSPHRGRVARRLRRRARRGPPRPRHLSRHGRPALSCRRVLPAAPRDGRRGAAHAEAARRPAAGVLRREELEALVAADVPPAEWPEGELRERVEQLTGGEPLEPMLLARAGRGGARRAPTASRDRRAQPRPRDRERGRTATAAGSRPRWRRAAAASTRTCRHRGGAARRVGPGPRRARQVHARPRAGGRRRGRRRPLMPPAERSVHEAYASGRAPARAAPRRLLALDRGLSQVEAGTAPASPTAACATG